MIVSTKKEKHGLPLVRGFKDPLYEGGSLVGFKLRVDPQVMPPLGLGGLTQRVDVDEFIHRQVPLEMPMPKDPHPSKYDPKIRHEMGGREVVEVVEPLHEGVERNGLAVNQTMCVDRYMPR